MKKAVIVLMVLIMGASSQATQLAFPGAEGYGAYATGGRGGDVYHVINLADYNSVETPVPGSLRYGLLTATGPRTIVFDISGYIDLHDRLEYSADNITIAGQTAPGDGITLRKWDVRLYQAHNSIVRYIRVRLGAYPGENCLPVPYRNGGVDTLSIEGGTDVIIDHCSLSWGVDEISSVTGDSNDITVQWTFITEPLNINDHAYGSLLRPAMTSRLTHHHNLYSDVKRRATRFGNYNDYVKTQFDWVNNVVYNWNGGILASTYSSNATGYWDYDLREGTASGGVDGELVDLNFIRNYFIAGADTSYYYANKPGDATNHKIWAENNYWDADKDGLHDGYDGGWSVIDPTYGYTAMAGRFSINSPLTIDTAPVAYDRVLTYGGNWLVRDAVDTRIISEVQNRTGSILYDQTSVGGFPALAEVNRPAGFDNDGDGMPTAWEEARWWLDPNDASDRNSDRDGDGYTNLEEYLNYVVAWQTGTPGDFDADNDVDWEDLALFLDDWLVVDPTHVPVGDLHGGDDYVDWYDFAVFAENWTG